MARKDDILKALGSAMPELRAKFAIQSIAIFGSIARGDDDPKSDVDILIQFEPDARVSLFTLARVQSFLEDTLHQQIDIVEDHANLRPSFRRRIEEDLVRVA